MKTINRKQLEDRIYEKVDSIPLDFLNALDSIVLENDNPVDPTNDIMKVIEKCSLSQLHYIWSRIQYLGGVTLIDELSVILLMLKENHNIQPTTSWKSK